jgi:long-chain acyl-CoA synthetase
MNVATWLRQAALRDPEAPAVGVGERDVLSYGALARRAASLAAGLRDRHGLQAGDRVAIVSSNHPAYVETLIGIWWGGFVAVPLNPKLHAAEVQWILSNCQASVALVEQPLAPALGGLDLGPTTLVVLGDPDYERLTAADGDTSPHDASEGASAWLFYTSGTTGRPKGAVLSHRNLIAMTMGYLADVDSPRPGDALLHAAPMSHGSGLYALSHVCRRGVNVIPQSGGFDADEVLAIGAGRGGVAMFAAPTMVNRIVRASGSLTSSSRAFRTLVWGGAPMYVGDVAAAIDALGPSLAQIYGQGETPMTITVLSKNDVAAREHPRWVERLGSAGVANSVARVRVVDADGVVPDPGALGEVQVRGATVMSGYWQDAEATATTLADGWLRTGDVGSFDEHGYLTLRDRIKDVIISGGSNIYPREVEEALLRHPSVREASVIGRPDPEWGEVVVAYVVGAPDPEQLDQLCLASMARFKRPKEYVTVAELPKNATGKILKTRLRQLDDERVQARARGLIR